MEDNSSIESERVAINDLKLEGAFINMGLKEERNNLISVDILSKIKEFTWVGENYELIKYFTNLKKIRFDAGSYGATEEEDVKYENANNRISSVFISLIDSKIINQLEDVYIKVNKYVDFRNGFFDTLNVWSEFKSIKKIVVEGSSLTWGIDKIPTENLEYFNIEYIPNSINNEISNYSINFNPLKIKTIKVRNPLVLDNLEDLYLLEELQIWRISAGTNLSKMSELKKLRSGALNCSHCIILSQEQLNNLTNLDFPRNDNEQQCSQSIADDKTLSKLFYPFLYVKDVCKTYYELNPELYEPYFD